MKKSLFFAPWIICMTLVLVPPCLGDEAKVGGAAGAEIWYSDWESENQWSKEGVDLDYDINPALVYGYSASINYFRKKTFIRGLMLDLLTSKMEHEINSEAFDGKDRDHGFYRKIRGKINQRIGSNGYFFIQAQHAKFEGEVTVKRGGSALDVPFFGKQTPMRGHPVFIAQHSKATCCRKCIQKWYGIEKGRALNEREVDYIVALIMGWIGGQ